MLRQALLNLALNACQAMPDGGTLRDLGGRGARAARRDPRRGHRHRDQAGAPRADLRSLFHDARRRAAASACRWSTGPCSCTTARSRCSRPKGAAPRSASRFRRPPEASRGAGPGGRRAVSRHAADPCHNDARATSASRGGDRGARRRRAARRRGPRRSRSRSALDVPAAAAARHRAARARDRREPPAPAPEPETRRQKPPRRPPVAGDAASPTTKAEPPAAGRRRPRRRADGDAPAGAAGLARRHRSARCATSWRRRRATCAASTTGRLERGRQVAVRHGQAVHRAGRAGARREEPRVRRQGGREGAGLAASLVGPLTRPVEPCSARNRRRSAREPSHFGQSPEGLDSSEFTQGLATALKTRHNIW